MHCKTKVVKDPIATIALPTYKEGKEIICIPIVYIIEPIIIANVSKVNMLLTPN